MPFEIIRNDITKVHVDIIVNAANTALLGGGGVDGAIHRAAGPELLEECRLLNGCETGEAKITKAYKLPANYIIHTVGPVWYGGSKNEEKLLRNCYRNSLNLAKEYKAESVAFPLISSGVYGYPKDEALKVASSVIKEFLFDNEMTVYLVIFDRKSFEVSSELTDSVKEYIDDRYVDESEDYGRRRLRNIQSQDVTLSILSVEDQSEVLKKTRSLDNLLDEIDDTFSEMLLRLIDHKGMTDVETYKKANIDRKLFSKIRNNPDYKPRKSTVIAFAIALELNLDETKDLLMSAGYALSHSSKFDIIIEYFIENDNYDIYEINQVLFNLDQKLLGV